MATVREYNRKLVVLRNTHKLTRTMKIAAANKLRRAQAAQAAAAAYGDRLTGALKKLPAAAGTHLLEAATVPAGPVLAIVIGTDRGLCGEFNNNLNRKVSAWMQNIAAGNRKPLFHVIGKRANAFFREKGCVMKASDGFSTAPAFAQARRIGYDTQKAFVAGRYGEVHIVYNKYRGGVSSETVVERLLPLEAAQAGDRGMQAGGGPIFSPSAPDVRDHLYPLLVNARIFAAMLNSAVSEHAARMLAMDSATKNVEDVLETTTLLRNKARQSAITRELIEIVAGAEALH